MELLATSIREDKNIEGIKGNKISLYADDTLIILKHPLENLEKLQSHLKEFESMTGLRINWDKTEIMTCNLNWRDQQLISEKFGVSIKDNLKYLGICISNKSENLKKLNYDKQMRIIKEQIIKYNKLKLSWFGRVALCKMMLLPKLNFLFDVLPIPLTAKDLNSYQIVFNQFCNGGKRSRIPKSLMYMPQKRGGLGIPNIQMYYKSFQIRNVVKILIEKKAIWEDIEMEDCILKGKALFLDYAGTKILCKSTMLKATWSVWQGLKKILAPGISPLLNLQDQANFPIKVDDKIKLILINNKVFYLKDWLLACRDENKRNEMYNQLGVNWFLKLKLNRWNNKYLANPVWDRDKTLFEKLIIDLKLGDNNIKGTVSKIYSILTSGMDSQCSMKQIWEQDLGKSIPEGIWNSLWKRRIMRNLSTRIKEHNYKIIWRWYLTPVRLNIMDKSKTNKCWRCNKMVGYYKHMWWDCEMVQLFWEKIAKEIFEILRLEIVLNPSVVMLTDLSGVKMDKYQKELLAIFLTAARLCIARNWKNSTQLRLEDWYKELWQLALNDKLTTEINIRKGMIKKNDFWPIWRPFVEYSVDKGKSCRPVPEQMYFWQR